MTAALTCPRCGGSMDDCSVNVEAFEVFGDVVCEECADEVLDEASEAADD